MNDFKVLRYEADSDGVAQETYNKYQVGDTIQVLIKYWEKPKKK